MLNKNKLAQVTIFIIIGIVIVVGIVLFLVLTDKIDITPSQRLNPQQYIEKCIKDVTLDAVDIMLPQGGYINPVLHRIYDSQAVAYLCYNRNFYLPCVNQEPMYIQRLESEIKNYIEPEVEKCFDKVKNDAESSGKTFDMGGMIMNVDLDPGQVNIAISRQVSVGTGESSESYSDFSEIVASPIYDLGIVAQEIVSQEARFCNFEYLGYSLTYPKFSIEKDQVGDEDTVSDIYKITDKISGKTLMIAIRSCALPGGL